MVWGMKEGFPFNAALIGLVLSLAGLGFFSMMGSSASCPGGRTVKSQISATSLATAVEQYYEEYNHLPYVPGRVTTNTPDGNKLLNVLSGLEPTDGSSGNVRKIRFLSLMEGTRNRGGVIYDSEEKFIIGLFDAWGKPFTVFLDTDSDEVLHLNLGSKEITLKGRRAAVVSPGKDKKLGTADDVKTS